MGSEMCIRDSKEREKLNARFGQESKQKAIQYIFDEAKKLWEKID